jgi:hypothetical protein
VLAVAAISAATVQAPARHAERPGASERVEREAPSERPFDADSDGAQVHLGVPDHRALLRPADRHGAAAVPEGKPRAHAYQYVSRVFDRPAKRPTAVGFVRRGTVLHAAERVPGPGCEGAWYRLDGRKDYVCSRDGFAISRDPQPPVQRQPLPDVSAALPYAYGKARSLDVLRYHRIPTLEEEQEIARALEADERLPDVVEGRLDGVYLLALDRIEKRGDAEFYRTVRGRYVRVQDVEPKPLPAMRGELLKGRDSLPLAFVHAEEGASLHREQAGSAVEVGHADKHARFRVAKRERWGELDAVVGPDGIAAARQDVRVVRAIERPADVGPSDKWIHVNLDEQALVAYEGDRPVFATLVSSGKGAEFATPTGLYQVREKHISTTMSGPDPDLGYYEVEEVPWTLYYHDSFALHGAYWHDDFGRTRSHGCTNIAPTDARWLFYWSDDDLPPGWHALRKLRGTWVYLTRERAPQ